MTIDLLCLKTWPQSYISIKYKNCCDPPCSDMSIQESSAQKLAYGEMQYGTALEMKYKRLRYSHSLAEAVVSQKQISTALSSCCAYQSNVVLISLSPSSEQLVPSIFPVLTRRMLLPCRAQLPFCSPSWNLLSDLCQTSTTHVRCHYAQFRGKLSLYINIWLSYSQLQCFTAAFCPPS